MHAYFYRSRINHFVPSFNSSFIGKSSNTLVLKSTTPCYSTHTTSIAKIYHPKGAKVFKNLNFKWRSSPLSSSTDRFLISNHRSSSFLPSASCLPFTLLSRFSSLVQQLLSPSSSTPTTATTNTSKHWYPLFAKVLENKQLTVSQQFELLGKLISCYPQLPTLSQQASWELSIKQKIFPPTNHLFLSKHSVSTLYQPFSSDLLPIQFLHLFCKLCVLDSDWKLLNHFLTLIYTLNPFSNSPTLFTSTWLLDHSLPDYYSSLALHAPWIALQWFDYFLSFFFPTDPRIYCSLAQLCFKVKQKDRLLQLETYVLQFPSLFPKVIPSIAESWTRFFQYTRAKKLLHLYCSLDTNVLAAQTHLLLYDFEGTISEAIEFVKSSNHTVALMDPLIRYLLKYPVYYVPSLWMYLELLEFHYSMTPSLDTLVQILAKASLIPGYPCTTLFQRIHIEKKVPCPPYIALAWLRYACRSDPSSVSTLLHLFYSHRWWLDENDAWYVFRLFKSTHRPSQDIAMLLHLLPSNALTSHFKQVCLKKFIQDQHLPFTQALAPHVDMTPTLARLIALKFPPITAMALLFPNDETEGWIHLNSELVQWTAFHAPALTLLLLQSLPFPLSDEQYGYYIKVLAELNLSDHLEHLVNYLPTPIPYPIQLALIKAYCKLNQPNQALLLLSSLPHPPPPHDPSVWISYYRCLVRQPNHSISPPPSSGSTMTYAPTSLSSTSTSASISTSISTSTSTSTSTSPFLNSMTMVPSDLFQKNVHVTSYFHLIMKSMIHHHQECQVSKVLPYVPTWTSSTLTLVVLAIHQHIMRPKHDQDPLWLDQMVQWIQLVVQQGFFQSHHWMKLIPSLAHGHRWQDLSVLLSHIPSLPLDTRGQCMKSGVFKIHLHESTKQSLTSLVLTRLNECQQQQQQQNKPFNGEMAIQLNLEIQEIQKLKKVIDSLP